jgi:cobalt-zinc-cadmium efflux system protein
MAHLHLHSHALPSARQLWKALGWVTLLTALEVVGAWASSSMALWGEAAHFVADIWAFAVALFAVSPPPSHSRLSYGRGQAIALGGLVNGLLQSVIGLGVAWGAVHRLWHPEPIEGGWMLAVAVAVLGLAINMGLLRTFGGLHMHEEEAIEGTRIHFIADAGLCGATVVTALVVALKGPVWTDSLTALLAAGLMLVTAWRLIRRVSHTLLAGVPSQVESAALLAQLQTLPAIQGVHHLHVWAVGHRVLGSVHVLTATPTAGVLQQAETVMRAHGVTHTTIQMETACDETQVVGCHEQSAP